MIYKAGIHLTIMCLIYDESGNILVQERIKNDWPGINLPGGHVEIEESLEEACVREIKEETGLDIFEIEKCGFYEWNVIEKQERHLCLLFRTNKFNGNLTSSSEGNVFWINIKDLEKYSLSQDLDKVILECMKGLNII